MKAKILSHIDLVKPYEKERARYRRAALQVECQNFAARHGYKFWNRVFNFLPL